VGLNLAGLNWLAVIVAGITQAELAISFILMGLILGAWR
jgi:hypothetical protein